MNALHRLFSLLLAVALAGGLSACADDSLTVYTAASMTGVIEEAAEAFHRAGGERVLVRTGSSGMLATEIEHGAPADIFVSADPSWTDRLVERGLFEKGAVRTLAWNSLVVVVPTDMSEDVIPVNHHLLWELERIAIGDPQSVPAGKYARQAMELLGIWEELQGKLVESPDVRAALALVERGEVQAGVVYGTDALASDRVKVAFTFQETSHDVIAYTAGVLKDAAHPQEARAFLDFLSGPPGVSILRERGFSGTGTKGSD